MTASLTALGQQIIDISATPTTPAARNEQVYCDLGLNDTTYHALLLRLIDRPEALAYNAVAVARLRRMVTNGAARRQQMRGASPLTGIDGLVHR